MATFRSQPMAACPIRTRFTELAFLGAPLGLEPRTCGLKV
jgi:hypothetical protein